MIKELRQRIKFWKNTDRIGPDILGTYWQLFFKSKMITLCQRKFRSFDSTSEVRPGAYVVGCSQVKIGKRVIIRPGTMLHAETATSDVSITIEDDVMIGCGVHIYVENHKFDRMDIPLIEQGHSPSKPVLLRKGCWIGANAILLPGVTIGLNSVVGAGAIVTKSVPDGVVVAGNPAKLIKKIV